MRDDGSGVGIVGLGVGLPEIVRTNDWWREHRPGSLARADSVRAGERRLAAKGIAARSQKDPFRGAKERRVLADGVRPSEMEATACRNALRSAALAPDDVDLLLGHSMVPDDLSPKNEGKVARLLGLGRHVVAMCIDAGCASFLPQLTSATRFVQCGDHRVALLFQSSATSRITDYDLPSSVIVGDGAVAEVVAPVERGLGFVGRVQLLRADLSEGVVLARSDENEGWYEGRSAIVVGSRDREAGHRMDSEAPTHAREACHLVLQRHGYRPDDVDFFVCAQAGAWLGEACADAVGIPAERFVPTKHHFEKFGHLLTGSVALNLWVAWKTKRLKKGDLVLLFAPGVGFVQAATLMRWSMAPPTS